MFGSVANAYTKSSVHANPTELQKLVEWISPKATDIALDIATGSGNMALALAPHVNKIVALDMTLPMLHEAKKNAQIRQIANLKTTLGLAENLPFQNETFDIITLRLAMHHFDSPARASFEIARALKPAGRFVFVDTIVPENPALAKEINRLEKLRDPSHGKNENQYQLVKMFDEAGLKIDRIEIGTTEGSADNRMDYDEWVNRINTPIENRAELKRSFHEASPEVEDALRIIEQNGKIRFSLPRISFLAIRS